MLRFFPHEHRKASDKRQISAGNSDNARKQAQQARDDWKAVLMARIAQIAKRHGGGRHE